MSLRLERLGNVTDLVSGESWPANRLVEEVGRRAERLADAGIGAGSRVAICHGGSPSFFADLLAVWRSGACAACLPANLTEYESKNILSFLEPRLSLTDASCLAADHLPMFSDSPGTDRELADSLDNEALILFTSGTTGQPKGVVHTYRSILARLALNQAWIAREQREISLCPLPTHFGHGLIGNCLTPLVDGGDLYLANGGDIRTAATLGELIDAKGITFMSSVASLWKLVIRMAAPPSGGTLKRLHVGSAPLSADAWKKIIGWSGIQNVVNMYGITETANWIGGASAADSPPENGLVGRPWGGRASVRFDDGRISDAGVGEILVQSPSLMSGYFRRLEETEKVLSGGWFATGDLGSVAADGTIRIQGRKKDEINRSGLKISPVEIDSLLESHESVQEACAFALADELAGEVVAVLVCPANEQFDITSLRIWCSERLAREKCPERWYVASSLPKTDRGKISRSAIAEFCGQLTPA